MSANPTAPVRHAAAASLARALHAPGRDDEARAVLRRYASQALVPLAIAAAVGAAWTAAAPLAGAVIAPAHLKVDTNRKTVQHQEGGIVREILVRDGQAVRANDPLVVLADVRSDAAYRVAREQLAAERARKARAEAEAALAAHVPDAGDARDPAAPEAWARERALFAARRRVLDEQVGALQAQIRDAEAQVQALQGQIDATETAARLSAEETEIHEKLARQGFVQRTRILALQRAEADYRARIGEQRSDLAAARVRIAELRARVVQARAQYQGQATDELKDAAAKVRELEERVRPSQDQVERLVVRAPVDGEVMALRVSGAGAVVAPREPILDVVPDGDKVVVEARIRPQDVDHVQRGQLADVRLASSDARTMPLLPGTLTFVSPDRVSGPNGSDAWFVGTVELDPEAIRRHPSIRLQAGMPAEVYLRTAERTPLDYLLKPVRQFGDRALREP